MILLLAFFMPGCLYSMDASTISKNFNFVVVKTDGQDKNHGSFIQYELLRGSGQMGKSKSYAVRKYNNDFYEFTQLPGSTSLEEVLREGQQIDPKKAFDNLEKLYKDLNK